MATNGKYCHHARHFDPIPGKDSNMFIPLNPLRDALPARKGFRSM